MLKGRERAGALQDVSWATCHKDLAALLQEKIILGIHAKLFKAIQRLINNLNSLKE